MWLSSHTELVTPSMTTLSHIEPVMATVAVNADEALRKGLRLSGVIGKGLIQ